MYTSVSELLSAQLHPFRTYSIENGLSESVVYDIIQDREGYIWLTTGYGLNKFDGLVFQHFFEDHGLRHSQTNTVYEGKDGRIWVGTVKGVQFILGDSVFSEPKLAGLEQHSVTSIFEDSEGGFWFGTGDSGVWYFNHEQEVKTYTTSDGLIGNEIRDIIQTSDGAIWFGTRDGLTKLQGEKFISFTMEDGLPENRIRDLELDPYDNKWLWIATRNGLAKFSDTNFQNYSKSHGLVNTRIRDITWHQNGDLWLATEEGVSRFRNGEFKNYSQNEGFTANITYSAFTDREGNIWFGTLGSGASVFLGGYFENYNTDTGLSNNLITSITETKDSTLWIGSYGGGVTALKNGNIKHTFPQILQDNRVYTVYTDSKDRVWVGMRDGLSYIEKGKIINLPKSVFPFRKIRGIMEALNGEIWLSTYDEGIIRFYDGKYEQITTNDGLPHNTTIASIEDEDGAIWFATYGGVTKLKNGEFEIFGMNDGLPNNGIMDIILDKSGTIWVSTFNGVAWYDGVKFVAITYEDGLPGKVCYFIHQDKEGYYWIGTNAGVARLDIQKYYGSDTENKHQAIHILQHDQGLISDEANLGAVFQDISGNIWLGTVEGVSKFITSEYRGNLIKPTVKLTHFTASGRGYNLDNINLKYNRDFIEIYFSAINFTAPELINYRYRIKGIDPFWQYTNERVAKYPTLPPGEYTFEVQAKNSSGIWSSNTATIGFILHPPYWLSWWFISIIACLFLGILFLLYRNYQSLKMVDIERMRVRIASDLHDDVGASLTEIALQSDFLQAISIHSELKKSLSQIGHQCRKIVTALDDIVWSIDARNDTLGDLTDRMQDYILNVLEPLNFQIIYDFEQLKMENHIPVNVKENLYLIFKEAVNNIAKYSNGNKVVITITAEKNYFELRIFDNGDKGTKPKKSGHGLRNMHMRAQRMNGKVDIDTKNGFTILLSGNLNIN